MLGAALVVAAVVMALTVLQPETRAHEKLELEGELAESACPEAA